MNYEKMYKDALERAKTGKPIDEIFPELAISEDEKIRKSIMHLVKKSYEQGGYALHKDESEKMLDYLEKQGNIVQCYEDALDKCACDNFNKGYKAALEKQKEQKLTELNDYDLCMIENILDDDYHRPLDSEQISWLKSLKDKIKGE